MSALERNPQVPAPHLLGSEAALVARGSPSTAGGHDAHCGCPLSGHCAHLCHPNQCSRSCRPASRGCRSPLPSLGCGWRGLPSSLRRRAGTPLKGRTRPFRLSLGTAGLPQQPTRSGGQPHKGQMEPGERTGPGVSWEDSRDSHNIWELFKYIFEAQHT